MPRPFHFGIVLLVLLATACGGTRASTSQPPLIGTPFVIGTPTALPLQTVRVIHSPGMTFAPLYVAIERGFMRQQGIEVELAEPNSAPEAIAQIATGAADVGALTLSAGTFNALASDLGIKVVASAGALGPRSSTLLLVRTPLIAAQQVTKVEDLWHRKVAISGGVGSAAQYILNTALAPANLSILDIEMFDLPPQDHAAALRSAGVDASVTAGPYSTAAVEQGIAGVLLRDWAQGAATSAYLYSGAFIKDRPQVATGFMAALIEGSRAMQGDAYYAPDNLAIYQKFTGATEALIRGEPPLVYDRTMGIAKRSVADQERFYREFSFTTYRHPLPIETYTDERFQREALNKLAGR